MRWYEYKMEVDDLHASDDLKAKLLAMQPAEEAPKPARKPKKAILLPGRIHSLLQHLTHLETVNHVLQCHHAVARRLVTRIQHKRAHTENTLQERTLHTDVNDTKQLDQVESLIQDTGFDAQFPIGKRVYGECEWRTAPITLTLPPQDIATCNLHR